MKPLNYLSLFGISILILSSCASIQQVADDDVYVSKNPALTTTEEVNDVSSYENYRYHKDRKINRVRYGSTSAAIVFSQNNYNTYSPFNDPRYYNYGYGSVYGSAMFFQFGNFDTYHYGYPYGYGNPYYNSYYSPYYNPYYYGNSCYGNPYYNGYNNNYNSYGYNNQTTTANNYHYGPRNTLSGVNNFGRRGTQQTLGISKKPNSGTGKNTTLASSSSQRKEISRGNTSGPSTSSSRGNISEVKSSRPVASGTGLSGSNKRVVTTSSAQRGSGTYNNSNSTTRTHDSGTTTRGTSSGSSRSTESGGGTFKSSGSSGGNSSPRGGGSGSGSSTPTRRGGR